MPTFAHLLPPQYRELVQQWLYDDIPTFDIGGYVVGDGLVEAHLLSKGVPEGYEGSGVGGVVLAGAPFFTAVFEALGCSVEWRSGDGDVLVPPMVAAVVRGPAKAVLQGERTALNILTRASGVATAARAMALVCKAQGWKGEIAGTRKVTPGTFRLVEKYALLVGGVSTHRMDLSQMTMLKGGLEYLDLMLMPSTLLEAYWVALSSSSFFLFLPTPHLTLTLSPDNHVWAAGSITTAVQAAKSVAGFSTKVEVEARSLGEAMEAGAAGADVVMLDNYPTPQALQADATALKAKYPHVLVEASGGIRLDTLASYLHPSVDILSSGSLTQGYTTADFSLKVSKGEGMKGIEKALAK